ncbi:MAG TPA: glutathione S-transferase family protein [Caulobacteraceae bacterium]|nr:glutathione S-transferase family protein [Caulobacteraceae bacterium]
MIVYGSTISPFVRKVHVAAAEKGIEITAQPINPMQPSEEFIACSPFRKIPALKDGDFQICDSSAIVHYFEALKPDPALIPAEAKARARTIWLEEFADTIMVAAGAKMFFNRVVAPRFLGRDGDLAAADKAEREELPPILDYVEGIVPEAGGFLVGESLTLADIAVASPFANFGYMDIDLSRWPKAAAYAQAILARPSFQAPMETERRILGRA